MFYFGRVEFEGPLRHPSKDVSWAVAVWVWRLGQKSGPSPDKDTLAQRWQFKAGHPEDCRGNLLFYLVACPFLHAVWIKLRGKMMIWTYKDEDGFPSSLCTKTFVQKFTFPEDGLGKRGFNYSSEGFIAVFWSLLVGAEVGLAFLKQPLPLTCSLGAGCRK